MESSDKLLRQLEAQSPGGWIRTVLIAVAALVLLVAAWTSFFTVAPEGRSVVKRFGRVVGIQTPGLHFKIPFGIDTVQFVPTERVLKEEFGFRTVAAGQRTSYRKNEATKRESLMLTGDLNVIDVEWVVQYRIDRPLDFLHKVRGQVETVRDVAEAVMRREVGNRLASDVLTVGRVEIAAEVREGMQAVVDDYQLGIRITGVEMQDVTPPDPVKPAFNEVNEARQERERLINLAEKERNQKIPRARGEAERTVSEAEAFRVERVNLAKGEAERFGLLQERFRNDPEVMRDRLYLETLDEVLPRVRDLYVVDANNTSPPLPLLDLGGTGGSAVRRGGGGGSTEAARNGRSNGGGQR